MRALLGRTLYSANSNRYGYETSLTASSMLKSPLSLSVIILIYIIKRKKEEEKKQREEKRKKILAIFENIGNIIDRM